MPACMGRGCMKPAEMVLKCGGEIGPVAACFDCGDGIMRALAPANVEGGASIEETAASYRRWREEAGRPVSHDEAIAVASAPLR